MESDDEKYCYRAKPLNVRTSTPDGRARRCDKRQFVDDWSVTGAETRR
jgi:hypothetical protein